MPLFLAHQGGWDEILYLAGPAIAVILWVRWAERRSRSRGDGEEPTATAEGPRSNIAPERDD